MKKVMMGLAASLMVATPAFANCDDYAYGEDGGWAVVTQVGDYTYHVMAHLDFASGYSNVSPGSLGALGIHVVCDMPSGSIYTPPHTNLDPIQAMSGDDSGNLYAGYLNAYKPDDLIIID